MIFYLLYSPTRSIIFSGGFDILLEEQTGLSGRLLSGQQKHELDTGGLIVNVI